MHAEKANVEVRAFDRLSRCLASEEKNNAIFPVKSFKNDV